MNPSNFNFSVIVCTYERPIPMRNLLESLQFQKSTPIEIIIVDSSSTNETEELFKRSKFYLPLKYFKVDETNKGLTKQRNVGISNLNSKSEIVFFLDDDVVLENDFFTKLLSTFENKEVIGADGYITNENYWIKDELAKSNKNRFVFDGYSIQLSQRDQLRALLGLYPFKHQPGTTPLYGHGKASLPPTGKEYIVDHIMGGITAYRTTLFSKIKFSEYFEGYGLYEDYDFSVRASQFGVLVTNTAARVAHYHAPSGRPNLYQYGKMVVKNGWYVWRLKHSHPGFINIIKWHAITLLLAFLRLSNSFKGEEIKRKQAYSEFKGRIFSWLKLFIIKPSIKR